MFVPSAAKAIPCSDALAIPIDPFRPVCTPLHWKSWLDALLAANLLEEFNDVPHGLRFGFRLGPTCPISHSFIPCNHNSATSNPSAIQDHISTELRLQRYTGPFHPDRLEQLIGPFQCSPLGVVPKANGLFRIIQDMSYPRDSSPVSSINSQISSADFPSEWSTFALCYWLVARAPPGSQAAVFDVDSAYSTFLSFRPTRISAVFSFSVLSTLITVWLLAAPLPAESLVVPLMPWLPSSSTCQFRIF